MNIKRVPLHRISQQTLFNVGDIIRRKGQKQNLYRVDHIQYIQDNPYYHLSVLSGQRRIIPQTVVEQWQCATFEELQEHATILIHVQKS